MKRPSFQFYPADWKGNANLRRCSKAARGDWMDIMCVLHDSDEYGVIRWPLADLANAAGADLKLVRELVAKEVLKGADSGPVEFVHTPRHAGKDGDPVRLVKGEGPIWFSSRMVRDEWRRGVSGGNTRFGITKPSTQPDTKPRQGDDLGDGASTSSSSSPSELSLRDSIGTSAPKPPRKARRGIPDGFPFEDDLAWARELWSGRGRADLVDGIADQAAQFRDHHQQHGKLMLDWSAAWRTWARNALKFTRAPAQSQFPQAKIFKVV